MQALGYEIACGNKESRIAVLNTETKTIVDFGHVGRHNRVRIVRWNRRWAPDLLAVCSKKVDSKNYNNFVGRIIIN